MAFGEMAVQGTDMRQALAMQMLGFQKDVLGDSLADNLQTIAVEKRAGVAVKLMELKANGLGDDLEKWILTGKRP